MQVEQTKKLSGHCLCEKVKIVAAKVNPKLGVCHCGICRTWCAGPFFTVDCGTEVEIEGREHLGLYDSSEWAQRGFCRSCGTSLFYYLKPASQYIVSSEIFKDEQLIFDHEIFIDEKPSYYSFANPTKKMTGAEVFAAFAGKD